MRRIAALTATVVVLTVPVLGLSTTAAHAGGEGTSACDKLDSGIKGAPGNGATLEVTAPSDKLITGYCTKVGNSKEGFEPDYVKLVEPLKTVVLRHSSGQALAHYSLTWTNVPVVETPGDETPGDETPGELPPVVNPPTSTTGNFDWNWKYATPSCDALTVAYPSDIPAGQSNDVNIRLSTDQGEVTLNYHNNATTWSGTQSFTYSQHASWPAGVTDYAVVWVQVAGSNYHFGESFHNAPIESPVKCTISSDGNPETYDAPVGVSDVAGLRTSSTVAKGRAAAPAVVSVVQPGLAPLTLQKLQGSTWTAVKSVAVTDGSATVTFPKQTRRGTFKYRLVLPGSESVTGDTTAPLTVRVR